ncbi:hypothetical protein NKDENANG_03639 [Candidatus Entotheonellaceae bacterium PAL068K]
MPINIPISKPYVILPGDPADSAQQADETLAAWRAGTIEASTCRERLNALAASYPTSLSTWAALGEVSAPSDVIAAYAFFRTGYHRGLDRGRSSGWNGSQRLCWEHENNRGFLRCLHGLMQVATTLGEAAEAVRTRAFLLDLDPTNPFDLEGA